MRSESSLQTMCRKLFEIATDDLASGALLGGGFDQARKFRFRDFVGIAHLALRYASGSSEFLRLQVFSSHFPALVEHVMTGGACAPPNLLRQDRFSLVSHSTGRGPRPGPSDRHGIAVTLSRYVFQLSDTLAEPPRQITPQC